jgi:hypothetical protein
MKSRRVRGRDDVRSLCQCEDHDGAAR